MALMRCVFEILYKGAWVIGRASENQAKKIFDDKFDWPGMGDIVKQADEALATEGLFESSKKAGWRTMNSLTHSGNCQLSRRFTETDLQADYDEAELAETIMATLTAVGLLVMLFLRASNRVTDGERVGKLLLTI